MGKLRNKGLRVLKFYILKNRFFFLDIYYFFTLFLIKLCQWLVSVWGTTPPQAHCS